VAFSGTMAIGGAARAYFIAGGTMSDARRLFRREKRAEAKSKGPGP
jgi:hypothetical protein